MTVTLTVRTAMWRSRVARIAAEVDGLVPVVKGNGYGFGRVWLADVAAELADTIAVGNVHELDGLPEGVDVVVLTPTLVAPRSAAPILTVGRSEHVDALDGWRGRVLVKLPTEMRRFGGDPGLVDAARATGLDVVGVSIHPPLAGSDDDHAAQIVRWLPEVDPDLTVWVSHLGVDAYRALPTSHRFRLRLGTTLWHGDKSTLHLGADVVDVRPITAGTPAGYRLVPAPADGHLVVVAAGTANGVTALPDGSSPFHFARVRLALLEPPHMHVAIAFVPTGDPLPGVGDRVHVQRPLTMTTVDEYRWL